MSPFEALGEPNRRRILDALMAGERPVNDLVEQLGWRSPAHIVVPMAGGSLVTKIGK